MKLKIILLSAVFFLLILSSCENGAEKYNSDTFFAMDTFITLSAKDASGELLKSAENKTKAYEKIFSRKDESSELYKINASLSEEASDELVLMIKNAFDVSEKTHNAFNPCLGAISDLWDFTNKKYVPSDSEISEILPCCSPGKVKIDGNTVSKEDLNTVIDLGACAKGYSAQKIIEYLKENGVSDAYVNFGGNVSVCGFSESGTAWKIGIKNPFMTDDIIGYIVCTDKTVSVSGDYERFFEKDGKIYHHIIDPDTGYPSDSGVKSVAVISPDGFISDALSTALFVMGVENSLDFYERKIYDFEAIFVTNDGKVYATSGIKDDFILFGDAYFDGVSSLESAK
ncbi:MAG: FAD:protein FMN transferase [Clostridiales bacterium]|nr:FAD:protein FMN transferase [Clostridiales bacterium]